jgi:hypothetical protein
LICCEQFLILFFLAKTTQKAQYATRWRTAGCPPVVHRHNRNPTLRAFICHESPASCMATIEEEIIHWWKDDKGESHRNALRLESEPASESNGFPRDGIITLRILNTVSQQAIKLSPDEALRVSTQLLSVAKDLMQQKRRMWNAHED